MDILSLLVIAAIISGGLIYIITHFPLRSHLFGMDYSPRLLVCKLLIPIDVLMTILLIGSPLALGINGVMSFVVGAFTAVGLSVGVYIIKKHLEPRWQTEFDREVEEKLFTIPM